MDVLVALGCLPPHSYQYFWPKWWQEVFKSVLTGLLRALEEINSLTNKNLTRGTLTKKEDHKCLPAVSRLPSEGGTVETLSTREGGAIGTIAGTPVMKYGG